MTENLTLDQTIANMSEQFIIDKDLAKAKIDGLLAANNGESVGVHVYVKDMMHVHTLIQERCIILLEELLASGEYALDSHWRICKVGDKGPVSKI